MSPQERKARLVAECWESNAEAWTALSRAGCDIYRDALNTPAFLAMLPPVEGLAGLDIGCGEGANTRAVARLGARMRGIDIAPTFIAHARESEAVDTLGVRYDVEAAEALPFEDAAFDFATSFMTLMDVADPAAAMREAARVIRPGGFLQYSILHPCFAPPGRQVERDAAGAPVAIRIADYFNRANGELEIWTFPALPDALKSRHPPFRVPMFHRTLSDWMGMIRDAGLMLEAMEEPRATEEAARRHPHIADTRLAPLFLIVRARKA